MNTKDLKALTFVGPTTDNLTFSPLAVLSLNNGLYQFKESRSQIIILDLLCVERFRVEQDWLR